MTVVLYAASKSAAGTAPMATQPICRAEPATGAQLEGGVHEHRKRGEHGVERPVKGREAEEHAAEDCRARQIAARAARTIAAAAARPSTNDSWYPSSVADWIHVNGESATMAAAMTAMRRRSRSCHANA